MSITLEELQQIAIESGLDVKARSTLIKQAEELEAAKKEEKGSGTPKSKSKYTVLIRGTEEQKKILENQEAFITKTPLDLDEDTIVNRIVVASALQNQNVKKKGKIATFADYFAFIKSKHRKTEDTGVQNVTKTPVRILVLTEAEIPFAK